MNRKPIVQEHAMGCAIACIAYTLKITYGDALKLFENESGLAKSSGFSSSFIVKVLNEKGIRCRYRYCPPDLKFRILGDIVFIKKSKRYPYGHYLSRAEDGWMDPWINLVSTKIISQARAGFRKRVPGMPIFTIYFDKDRL